MDRSQLTNWLREDDAGRLTDLWYCADAIRRKHVGDAVHLRGLIEISNHCRRACLYCGLRAENRAVRRYRLEPETVLLCARRAARLGCGTVVLQAGEDPALTETWVADVVRRIKAETGLAVTLSLGERTRTELEAWRAAGADRYLLRFETSNAKLFAALHPPLNGALERMTQLGVLRELGYEVGSGVMIGVPGQSHEDVARDIELFGELNLDMVGVGPFIAHADTPMGAGEQSAALAAGEQVSADAAQTYKVMALTRVVCPQANIPATTALAALEPGRGYELALQRGANVIMPNFTPAAQRDCYQVYPGKGACDPVNETTWPTLLARIASVGRTCGAGRGDSPNWQRRQRGTWCPAAERSSA